MQIQNNSDEEVIAAPSYGKGFSWLKRMFRPRDILIRSQGRVRFINLSPRLQVMLLASTTVSVVWLLGITATSLWQSTVIDERNQTIAEAKTSHQRVSSDFLTYKSELERISAILSSYGGSHGLGKNDNDLSLSQEMLAFRVLGEKVTNSLDRAALDFDVGIDDLNTIVKSRTGLHNKIILLQVELATKETEISKHQNALTQSKIKIVSADKKRIEVEVLLNNLGRKVKDLTIALSDARKYGLSVDNDLGVYSKKIADLVTLRTNLLSEQNRLTGKLQDTQQDAKELLAMKTQAEERVALLYKKFARNIAGNNDTIFGNTKAGPDTETEDLSNMPLNGRISILEDTSSTILSDLVEYREMSHKVEQTLDGVVAGLSRVTGYTRIEDTDSENRPDQALRLLSALENIHDDQLNVLSTLVERTDKAINYKQTTLSNTGIDLNKAMELAGLHTGKGGPLHDVADFTGGSSAGLNEAVSILEAKMLQLQALDKLVACVPLVSPVDYYHLTSKFGKRKDPFTGKKAIHKGVDLGGWPGTKVHATAAGKVLHAGNSSKYGNMVEIDHGCGIVTRYGHLLKVLVKKGEVVPHRKIIGKLGSTGRSTGPHVHFEIRVNGKPVDPMKFVEAGRHVYKG